MKYVSVFIIYYLFISVIPSFSQEKFYVNVDVGYPSPDEKFFTLYKGVLAANFGVGYKLTNNVYAGISFNSLFIKQKNPVINASYYFPAINIKYEQKLPFRFLILPEAGIGLSFLNLKSRKYDYNETQKGINLYGKIALGYPICKTFDILVYYRYDYIHLKKDEEFTKLEYFRNLHITNFGISINFKFLNK